MFQHFSKHEAKKLILLGIPVFLGQIAQLGMSFVDTVVAGRYAAVDMAAVAVATSFWVPGTMFGLGLLMALTPLVAQAQGAGKPEESTQLFRQGIWMGLAIAIFLMLLFLGISHLLPRWEHIDPQLSRKASEYLFAVLWGVPALMFFLVERCFLEGHGQTRPGMIAGFIGLGLNIPLNIVFVFGMFGLPELGAAGCGVATAILFWFQAASLLFFVSRTAPHALGMAGPVPARLKRLFRIGLPGAFAMLNETAAFALIAIIVAPLGVTTVASHQIALNISSLVWVCTLAFGSAGTIRVGTMLGAGRMEDAKTARITSLCMTLIMSCILATLLYAFRYQIAAIYNDTEEVLKLAGVLLICDVVYQFPDGIQTNTLCALRGWNDTRAIFLISFLAYWCISLPLGWVLCMTDWITREPLGVLGFWIGLIVALSVAATLYLLRIRYLESLTVEQMRRKIGR